MFTIIESPIFTKLWPDYWTEEERGEFAVYLALNPDAGKLIVGSGGCRKIRWAKEGSGKSGGVRIIYTAKTSKGQLWLLTIYSKNVRDTIPAHVLRKIAEELENADE